MIRITVELLPGGDPHHTEVLGVASIENDQTGDLVNGNYKATLRDGGNYGDFDDHPLIGRGEVKDFPRESHGHHVWDLVRAALNSALEGRWSPRTQRGVARDRILDLRAEGHSYRQIADRFNQQGFPSLRGGAWNSGTVHKLEKN